MLTDADAAQHLLVEGIGCRWHKDGIDKVRRRLLQPPWRWSGEVWDDIAWGTFSQKTENERVYGLIYDAIRSQDLFPQPVEKRLHDAVSHTAVTNRIRFIALVEVLDLLDTNGIQAIALKGSALIAEYYKNPGVRPMVDMDVLVRKEDAARAWEILSLDGFSPFDYSPHPGDALRFENEIMLQKPGNASALLELHWGLFDSPHYQTIIDNDWFWQTITTTEMSDQAIKILGPEALILHLCGHIYLHHAEHQNLLWLSDVAEVIFHNHRTINWNLLVEKAREFDLILSVSTTLSEVEQLWQAPVPPDILEQLSAAPPSSIERRILADRDGHTQSVALRFKSDLVTMPNWQQRLAYAMHNLFPSGAYMVRRYNIRHRVLIPLYYPYRWAIGLADLLKIGR